MSENKKIKLVLSGSGTRFPVHVGGIMRLAEEGYEFEAVCGTSGGAIIAGALASGYAPNEEMIKLIKSLLPKNNLIDYSILSLLFNWGLIKGNKIEKIFSKMAAPNFGATTIPLHVVTTNLNRQAGRVFSTHSDPNMSVARAVRASMSIPGVFAPVRIDGEMYVDGGVAGNYMLDIFGAGEDVIGLTFGRVNKVMDWEACKPKPIKSVKQFMDRNIDTMIAATTREHVEDAVYARTIPLLSKHSSLNLYMNEKDVDDMIEEGYVSVDRWINNKES